MGVCIKLATRSLRKNKGRTLITLMGIVLSVLMVCTIFTLLNSMLDSAIDSIIEKDGNWHIAVYNTTAEQIADLEAAEGVLSTQMISIDENDVFRITLKNPDEVYEFASRYLSETTEYSYHTELLSYLGISQSDTMPLLYPFPKGRKNSDFYPRLVQPKKIFARLYIPKLFYLGRLRYRSV